MASDKALKKPSVKTVKVVKIRPGPDSDDEMQIMQPPASPDPSDIGSEVFDPNPPDLVHEMLRQFRTTNGALSSDFHAGTVTSTTSMGNSVTVARPLASTASSAEGSTQPAYLESRKTLKPGASAMPRQISDPDSGSAEAEEDTVAEMASSSSRAVAAPASSEALRKNMTIQRRLPPGLADGQPPRRLTIFTGAKRASQMSDDSVDEPAG